MNILVVKRDGSHAEMDTSKIANAILAAFLDDRVLGKDAGQSETVRAKVDQLTKKVVSKIHDGMNVEGIQDTVEKVLMESGEHKCAREYVLYRERKAAERSSAQKAQGSLISITRNDGTLALLPESELLAVIKEAATGLSAIDEPSNILAEVKRNIYDGATEKELDSAMLLVARQRIEQSPDYAKFTARVLLQQARNQVSSFLDIPHVATHAEFTDHYPTALAKGLEAGVKAGLLSEDLVDGRFDVQKLGAALVGKRDFQFNFLGMQTIYDRYFLHVGKQRIELPQTFFMRVAMGLAIKEDTPTERAIEFYSVLSKFDFMSSTPTLFNTGSKRSQLSSCYLTSVPDDLHGIFGAVQDNAMLSKFAGGLGNDWTPVRSLGSHIQGTNGESQGVVPFLKVANDTALAVNQGGKRKGAVCAYLETWHLDIEEFLELRKNTGDDRRRTHDMNTANWIPDLFMKRVAEKGSWTLFTPNQVPDLHDLFGAEFEKAYVAYEEKAAKGEIKTFKTVDALGLWRKMLSMVFETGHPWMTFKDPCNIRSPQQHVGVVHSSNLCTEITLNTKSGEEIAVCNLGSINIVNHISDGKLDAVKLKATARTAMRMLDNVVDINFYPVEAARTSNMRHRPVGLGLMGFQDALYLMDMPYSSREAVEFADIVQEHIAYSAIEASSDLAVERGCYESFKGSLWSKGVMPQDSIAMLEAARGVSTGIDLVQRLDWDALREKVMVDGMRNSNCMAIAPTATIANIIGVSQSIEPTYQNLYVKSNLSGEFTVINPYLVEDLKGLGLWDSVMISDLKFNDGSVQTIARVPAVLKAKYACAFEMDSKWLVEAAARRQKWIDQGQSLNLYMAVPNGKALHELYTLAWERGLKTTYYLRTLGATHAEKSTVSDSRLNAVQAAPAPKVCSILDGDCESCS